MNPYLFTIAFLILMGLLTSSEMIRFTQSSLEKNCYLASRSLLAATEEIRETTHLEELRGEDPPPKIERQERKRNTQTPARKRTIPSLRIYASRPPNNSRLNLYKLLQEAPNSNVPEDYSLYEVLAQLMRNLYGNEPFFHSGVEYQILDQIIAQREAVTRFTTPDELATLLFDPPELQDTLYAMLKGTKNATSMLHYLTYETIDSKNAPSRKINFLFAHADILHALFPHGNVAQRLIARQEEIWAIIWDQEVNRKKRTIEEGKGRSVWNKEIKNLIEEVLSQEGLDGKAYTSQVFDYGLNEPGTVLFAEDPLTGILIREKYTPLLSP